MLEKIPKLGFYKEIAKIHGGICKDLRKKKKCFQLKNCQ